MKRFLHDNLWAIIGLALVLAASLVYTTWAINSNRDSQMQQGRAVEARLCSTFSRLADDKPPPLNGGSASGNPSRIYLEKLHTDFIVLGRDVGCRINGR